MKLKLDLTLDQINYILGALSNMPFNQVVDLITTIRLQAEEQVSAAQAEHKLPNVE